MQQCMNAIPTAPAHLRKISIFNMGTALGKSGVIVRIVRSARGPPVEIGALGGCVRVRVWVWVSGETLSSTSTALSLLASLLVGPHFAAARRRGAEY